MSKTKDRPKTCWVITDGKAGMVSQALGLAEALGIPKIISKQCRYNLPWSLFPAYFGLNSPKFLSNDSDSLTPPWPDILISCGRQALGVSLYVKKQSKGKTFTICLQDPRINCKYFDLVIPMEHDGISGDNVIISKMALHRVNPMKLEQGRELHKDLFLDKTPPYLTVLLGGSSHRYRMNSNACKKIIYQLESILNNNNGTLFITPSRRTPKELITLLNNRFKEETRVVIIDPLKNNPYFGMLAMADCIFVTDDSVSMVSEACATGKKIYILPLLNHKLDKAKIFTQNLARDGIVEIYNNEKIVSGKSKSFNETLIIAKQVRKILIEKQKFNKKDFNITVE
jgi:mitochondrial fission protein ELM1